MSKAREPMEEGGVEVVAPTRASAEAAAAQRGTPTGSLIYAFFSFIVFVFVVVATPVAWLKKETESGTVTVSPWQYQTKDAAGTTLSTLKPGDLCNDFGERMKASGSFAIISIALATVNFLASVAINVTGRFRFAAYVFGTLLVGSTLITFAIMVNLYIGEFCGSTSLEAQNFYIYAGTALFVSAFALSIVMLIVLFIDPLAPKGERGIKFALNVFLLCSVAALALSTIGTGLPFFSKYVGNDRTLISLWQLRQTESGITTTTNFYDGSFTTCKDFAEYVRSAAGLSIGSIAFGFFAVIASALGQRRAQAGNRGISIMFGLIVSLLSLAVWAMMAKAFYTVFCGEIDLAGTKFRFDSGFVLYVTAFCVQFFGTFTLVIAQIAGRQAEETSIKYSAVAYVVGVVAITLLCVVGVAIDHFELNNTTDKTLISPWHIRIEFNDGSSTTQTHAVDYWCSEFGQRMKGVAAFGVLAAIFSGIGIFVGLVGLAKDSLRVPSVVFSMLAAVALLISWGISVSTFHKSEICASPNDMSLKDRNGKIVGGPAVLIAAWVAAMVISAFRCVNK